MGFATAMSSIASSGLSNATSFVGDLSPVLGLYFGVAIAGTLVMIFARFVNR